MLWGFLARIFQYRLITFEILAKPQKKRAVVVVELERQMSTKTIFRLYMSGEVRVERLS